MELPFTLEEFLDLFKEYNEAIWPAQYVALSLGFFAVIALLGRKPWGRRAVLLVLAIFWLWSGLVYHFAFFREINPVASVFAGLFCLQAVLLSIDAFREPHEARAGHAGKWFGWIAVTYALAGYPLLNLAFGHAYPAMPVFGVAPCPTVIFTFGILMILGRQVRGWQLVVPSLWALVGSSAAMELGMREDVGLPIAAVLAISVRIGESSHVSKSVPATKRLARW